MSSQIRLNVAIRHRVGSLALDVEFTLTQPWTVLFAPSGAGKSTVLRIIAGLLRPDSGHVIWSGPSLRTPAQAVSLTDTAQRIFVPPHRRAVRFVGQRSTLFPHKTVLQNVTYGMMRLSRDRNHREIDAQRLQEILRLCQIEKLVQKKPSMLSGGETQRVAIARAIAPVDCRLLLLDEPFSGLDSATRDDFAADLQEWLSTRNIPALHVTHDVSEVFALAAEVIRLSNGMVVEQGPVGNVLHGERENLLAHLLPLSANP